LAHHLAVAEIGGSRKNEHDMHILKRLDKDILRMSAKKGSKVLHVYDRAGIDYMQSPVFNLLDDIACFI